METTPDKYCTWEVYCDYLHDTLGEIHRNGSTVVSVVASEFEMKREVPSIRYRTVGYRIIYFNPPTKVIPGVSGSGDAATIQ